MGGNPLRVPIEVADWLLAQGAGPVQTSRPVSGGCISSGRILKNRNGSSYFLKTNVEVPVDFFRSEAEGLAELAIPRAVRVPEVYLYGKEFILMEDLGAGAPGNGYWESLGSGLAAIHQQTSHEFGFKMDNFIGSTPQPNLRDLDGFRFFAEQRLNFQARLAYGRRLLGDRHLRQLDRLTLRLSDLVPVQPASLTHGDLWSGNVVCDRQGYPALIDPAVYYGWAETDLAMTTLFGHFPPRFYDAYQETRPLNPGYPDRFPLYNLYHLLNHLNLFGQVYLSQIETILTHYD